MPLAHVFLDFGGTLARERRSRAALYADAARAASIDADEGMLAHLMAKAHAELPRVTAGGAMRYSDAWFRLFIEHVFHGGLGVPRAELPGLEERLFACFSDPATFEVFPGTVNLIEGLRAHGVGVGVLSNWSPRLDALLGGLGLVQHLDPILASAKEGLEKPEPAFFELALTRAGVRPEQALHAGDHIDKDIRGARAAGLAAVLVDHAGDALVDRQAEPGVTRVPSLDALLDHVRSLCP